MIRAGVIAVVVCGCHKDAPMTTSSPSGPASTTEVDALWAKAPQGATIGVVASPRAIAMTEHAWHDVHVLLAAIPQFTPVDHALTTELAELGLGPDARLADLGLAPAKGLAVFVVGESNATLAVVPVVDRDRFVAAQKGAKTADGDRIGRWTCKPIDGGLYACASDVQLFAQLGKGDLRAGLGAAKARGDLEIVVAKPVAVAIVGQLERGSMVLRGAIIGVPPRLLARLGAPVKPRVELGRAAGFAVLNVAPLVEDLPATPIVAGVTLADLAHSIGGPLTVSVGVAALAIDASLPLRDATPAKAAIEHCAEIAPLAAVGAKLVDGGCHLTLPSLNLELVVRVDNNELRIATAGPPPSSESVPMSAIGAELATGDWSAAFWGRGTVLAPTQFPGVATGALPAEAAAVLHGLVMLNELGGAARVDGDTLRFVVTARTAWANPDEVVAKLRAVDPAEIVAGRGGALGKSIADASPSSPFAADFQAGYGGLMLPTGLIGMFAAIAISAVVEYTKQSKQTEASLQLTALGKKLKVYYAEHGSFPVGDAPPTPHVPTCCGLSSTGHGMDNKCPVDEAAWRTDKIWAALEFAIDEPTPYRFGYHSDGKTVTAAAIGDLDCDGAFATWALHGEAPNGHATMTITKPPPGAY